MRKPILAGNWKMNLLAAEAKALAVGIVKNLEADPPDVDVVLCPSASGLMTVITACQGSMVKVGAQNLHWEKSGAYTGEISASMVKDMGCEYVIVGHSERRQYFGESNEIVNRKLKSALAEDLNPIVCVGENLQERESGMTENIVREHVIKAFAGLSRSEAINVVIAYEPVWAIGTGKTASPKQAQEVPAFIREIMTELYDPDLGQAIRIQYGGSVKPANIALLISQPDIDGALVGGAALNVDSFCRIIRFQS